jgi:hypothetical protein
MLRGVSSERVLLRPRPLLTAVSAGLLVMAWVVFTTWGGAPVDANSYWHADPSAPYLNDGPGLQYIYAPVFIQLISPFLSLSFEAFVALIRALELLSLLVLAGPVAILALFLSPVASEINAANINLVFAVCIVLGFRWPILWVPILITKPSAGIGLLWFVLRGEWKRAMIPVLVAGGLSLLSFLYRPELWFDWLAYLRASPDTPGWPFPIPVWPRLPISLLLVVIGARTGRPWMAVLATILAWPRLYFQSIALLLALLPALGMKRLKPVFIERVRRADDRPAQALPPAG